MGECPSLDRFMCRAQATGGLVVGNVGWYQGYMAGLLKEAIWPSTALTLLLGCVGAAVAWYLSAPVYILIGPALLVSLAGLVGVHTSIHNGVRDVCFLVLGVAVGSGFDADALAAMQRWPLAFLVMAGLIVATLALCRVMLTCYLGFDRRGALLAAAPGHLSFVIALAADLKTDVVRVTIAQSVRLLALTLLVPFAALALGMDMSAVLPEGTPLSLLHLILLLVLGFALGRVFEHLSFPAPLLLGTMVVSGIGHLSELTPGVMPRFVILPAYLVLGALIGTRFSGVTFQELRQGLAVGVVITLVAVLFSVLGALPVAWALGMPPAHVLVAFSPGGLETMIAMGVVLGVVPGFVAACHIARLLILTIVLPAMLGRRSER